MRAIEINLLPPEFQQAQARARHVRNWLVGLIAPVLLLLVLLGVDGVRGVQADELRRTSEDLQSELSARRAEVRGLTAAAAVAALQLQRSDALRSKRAWSTLIDLVGQCMPAECWLESLATDPELPASSPAAPPVTGSAPSGGTPQQPATVTIDAPRKLRIAGYATSAGQPLAFVTNLKQTGTFKSVNLERSVLESELGQARFRFEIICEW